MTIEQFAKQLEDLWHASKSAEKATFKVGILLPWDLRHRTEEIQPLIPHLRVIINKDMAGTIVELWSK